MDHQIKDMRCAANNDPSGRRGIWFNIDDQGLDLAWGREGEFTLRIERTDLSPSQFYLLKDVFVTCAWVYEDTINDEESYETENFEDTGHNEAWRLP